MFLDLIKATFLFFIFDTIETHQASTIHGEFKRHESNITALSPRTNND